MKHRTNRDRALRLSHGNLLTACSLSLCLIALSQRSSAVELWSAEEGERRGSLDTTLKWSSLLSHAPDDPSLFPERWSGVGLFRARLGLNARYSSTVSSEVAYEHRARLISDDAGVIAGGDILPSQAKAAYRISQLDWELVEADTSFAYRHELDRALVALHPPWGQVTIGRQAIGLGRAVLFGAVDIFTPFSPLEVDREWRRGVDAARVEVEVSDTSSVELLAAFGETWDDSALIARARGYIANIDGELIVGKRAEDAMYAGIMSATVGDAEVHVELAVFDTPEPQPDGGLFGTDDLVGKGVLGASYTFNVGNGLTLLGEYHYSGFGVKDMEDAMSRLTDTDFQERYLRGDMQVLGRHAIALQLTYPINSAWTAALLTLQNPLDGSGLAAPSLGWDFAESVSLVASAFIPWGEKPSGGQLRSEYGGTPISLFLQLNMYY